MVLALLLSTWPADDATVTNLPLPPRAAGATRVRLYLDAGHGAPGNEGNHGVHGQLEQVHTLAVAEHVAKVLRGTGLFDVKVSRRGSQRPRYAARVAEASAWRADVIVSLHSDVRGDARWTWLDDGGMRLVNTAAPGFAVLWNDEGTERTVQGRVRLGRAIGARLVQAGFLAYSGEDYSSLYRADEMPWGWVDDRPLAQRVYFLRASRTPTVIVETHHALDPVEVARWEQPSTLDAFAYALGAAVLAAAKPMK